VKLDIDFLQGLFRFPLNSWRLSTARWIMANNSLPIVDSLFPNRSVTFRSPAAVDLAPFFLPLLPLTFKSQRRIIPVFSSAWLVLAPVSLRGRLVCWLVDWLAGWAVALFSGLNLFDPGE
jgi:hypothetical protein